MLSSEFGPNELQVPSMQSRIGAVKQKSNNFAPFIRSWAFHQWNV